MKTERDPDQDLADLRAVHAVLQGNHDAFRDIVHRYTPPIYSLAVRMTRAPEDAEEAVQEIFSDAFRKLKSFDTERRFFPWLYTIALNNLRSRARSAGNRHHRANVSLDNTLQFVLPASAQHQPEERAIRADTQERINRALDTLQPDHREVFVLRHMEGYSGAEVAEMLGIPENTVKTYAFRARKALRDVLVHK